MSWKKLFFILLIFFLFFKNVLFVWGASFQDITASIKISVCGDGIIEGEEDCEGGDLNSQTCESLGYGPGILSCDIACSFDTSDCAPAPTSTATPTPTLITEEVAGVSGSDATNTPTPIVTINLIWPTPTISFLPKVLTVFDNDGNGKIGVEELFLAVKLWVNDWRRFVTEVVAGKEVQKLGSCDLNFDKKCNLVDLSILLYYIGN